MLHVFSVICKYQTYKYWCTYFRVLSATAELARIWKRVLKFIKFPCNKLHSSPPPFFFPLLFKPFLFFLYRFSRLLAYKTKHFPPANTKTRSRAQRIQLVKGLVTRPFQNKTKKNIDVYIVFSSSTTNFSPHHVRSVGFLFFSVWIIQMSVRGDSESNREMCMVARVPGVGGAKSFLKVMFLTHSVP